ncbi:MAG: hypothetical protein VXZ16_05320 [Bacteroidota bacterium]|nr:hypothetical protein [Bacteroidota bacterium]
MEKQITAVALVLSVAGLGYLKAQQMERMEAKAERDAAAAVIAAEEAAEAQDEANRVQFEVPHDRDASTSDVDIVLDGMASYDADMDSISFSWVQTEGPDVALSEDESGRSSFRAAPGKYTFELTVTDAYGAASSKEARVNVTSEPNTAPEVHMSVYAESAE